MYIELAFAIAEFNAAVTSTPTMLLPGTSDGDGSRLLSSCTTQVGLHRASKRDVLEPAAVYDAVF